jgi:archaeal flagellin FlaB
MNWVTKWSSGKQQGTSGIEAALLIGVLATVGSAFAYVIMSAGLFSSQKAKEAVSTGIEGANTTLEIKGNISAAMENGFVNRVYLIIGSLPGGTPVDFTGTASGQSRVIISYSDSSHIYNSLDWSMKTVGASNGDNFLDPGEICQVSVDLSPVNEGAASESEKLVPFHKFRLEISPPNGGTITIERTIPSTNSRLVNLN